MSGRPRSPSFRDTFLELYDAFDAAGLKILARDRALPRASTRIISPTRSRTAIRSCGCCITRRSTSRRGNHIRAGAHEDINTITLLLGAEEAGLELKTKDGRWLPVSPKPGELVVNIGDMLQRLTNGRLRSTSHRVVNPAPDRASKARYSMPFFLHFRPDFIIEALPGHGAGGRGAEVAADLAATNICWSGCARSSWPDAAHDQATRPTVNRWRPLHRRGRPPRRASRGVVEDRAHVSKAGHVTISVRQDDGVRFKTLAKSVSRRRGMPQTVRVTAPRPP